MGTSALGADVAQVALHRRGTSSRCNTWTHRYVKGLHTPFVVCKYRSRPPGGANCLTPRSAAGAGLSVSGRAGKWLVASKGVLLIFVLKANACTLQWPTLHQSPQLPTAFLLATPSGVCRLPPASRAFLCKRWTLLTKALRQHLGALCKQRTC